MYWAPPNWFCESFFFSPGILDTLSLCHMNTLLLCMAEKDCHQIPLGLLSLSCCGETIWEITGPLLVNSLRGGFSLSFALCLHPHSSWDVRHQVTCSSARPQGRLCWGSSGHSSPFWGHPFGSFGSCFTAELISQAKGSPLFSYHLPRHHLLNLRLSVLRFHRSTANPAALSLTLTPKR